jgi:hypothetical protein
LKIAEQGEWLTDTVENPQELQPINPIEDAIVKSGYVSIW